MKVSRYRECGRNLQTAEIDGCKNPLTLLGTVMQVMYMVPVWTGSLFIIMPYSRSVTAGQPPTSAILAWWNQLMYRTQISKTVSENALGPMCC